MDVLKDETQPTFYMDIESANTKATTHNLYVGLIFREVFTPKEKKKF